MGVLSLYKIPKDGGSCRVVQEHSTLNLPDERIKHRYNFGKDPPSSRKVGPSEEKSRILHPPNEQKARPDEEKESVVPSGTPKLQVSSHGSGPPPVSSDDNDSEPEPEPEPTS